MLEITKEIMEENKEEMIRVLYCDVYGGWNLSKKAIKMYRERTGKINTENPEDNIYFLYIERHDRSCNIHKYSLSLV